jgi:putative photosynthetic complex assembly protein
MRDVSKDPEAMRIPVLAGTALIGFSLLVAGFARLTDLGTHHLSPVVAVHSKDLTFAERADGTMVVTDVARPDVPQIVNLRTNGFIKIALDSLTRERRAAGADPSTPYRLMREADGRLWLEDLATQRRLTVDGFGPPNTRSFAQLLDPELVATMIKTGSDAQ